MNRKDLKFEIHPALHAEAVASHDLQLCQLILRDEARWPWVVLVPRRSGVEEVFDLLPGDREQLWREVEAISAALKAATGAEKINIAQFGNVTRQLHVHIVARSSDDPQWPGGVVGVGERQGFGGKAPQWWAGFISTLPAVPG
ncbi:MAG: HIT domain-containing protein [Parvularcula sp.]